ncbi:MAG: ferritin-like domain-containing protein [Thermoanaerobaculia bacterium]|nr:ferritin-like domain-containing protein [Thermoanaerobaculia bacterium]
MKIYKVLPDLSKERHMKIWHKALHSQWSASDLPWKKPLGIRSPKLLDQMGRLLTPVLMGEQAALYSVSGLIPVLGKTSEVESQFYLTTWAVDEARHTELFTLFYHRLGREPLPIRRFPQGYLFQSAIVSDDPAEWLSGVLVSEVTAKKLMEEFRRVDIDPLLTDIADGILLDEARHLGFNHIYIEDKFKDLVTEDPEAADRLETHLHERIRGVHELLGPALDALHDEMAALGIDRIELYDKVIDEAAHRLQKSIDSGRRLAAREAAVESAEPALAVMAV